MYKYKEKVRLVKEIEKAESWDSVIEQLEELARLTGFEKEFSEADGEDYEQIYDEMSKDILILMELNKALKGWTVVYDIDFYLYYRHKCNRYGELSDNIRQAIQNESWSYETEEGKGYNVCFNEYDIIDGEDYFFVTHVEEL